MKLSKRFYAYALWDIFIGRPLKRLFVKLRYVAELGGKGGYEINGAPGYWGRYGTPEKIVELASELKGDEDDISFYLPAIQYELKYSHKINIWGTNQTEEVLIEFIYASDQCGSYEKTVKISSLLNELNSLNEIQVDLTGHGYTYVEY